MSGRQRHAANRLPGVEDIECRGRWARFRMARRRQRIYLPGVIHQKRKIDRSQYSINNPQPLPLPLPPRFHSLYER
ncbi:hypothetical protein M408DRAFT_331375 [Serendipita vermifera MAFF 305830]|uniref:Uncharacterized protein n=1 Tax=Serendipita vermifera MAFF 305830 TaxID=933852 RepID=A0A0C3B0K4_SERVB|nr:hypothetical protein M408DRAFT_331375 [Serendipita vermifera MAFF 305830]